MPSGSWERRESQRPLTGSDADRRLFVDRSAEMGHLARAAELEFNVLVLGERGSGVTSLMYQHQRRLQDSSRSAHYARAARTDKLADLITVIRIAVEGPRAPAFLGGENIFQALYAGGDPDALRGLRRLVTAETRSAPQKATIILDEMHNAELVHELFGRHRDDVAVAISVGRLWPIDAKLRLPGTSRRLLTVHRSRSTRVVGPTPGNDMLEVVLRRDGRAEGERCIVFHARYL